MNQLHLYPNNAALPAHIYWQVQTFLRTMQWGEPFEDGDSLPPIEDDALHPTYAAVCNGDVLLAFAGLIQKTLTFADEEWICGGVGSVFTFPAFRKQGYGRQVVEAITAHMRRTPSIDFGLLWTNPRNQNFYAHSGWEVIPELTTLTGSESNPEIYDDEVPIMVFCSQRAKVARALFEQGRLYIGPWTW